MSEAELIERFGTILAAWDSAPLGTPAFVQADRMLRQVDNVRVLLSALTASLAREGEMRRALEPFARVAKSYDDFTDAALPNQGGELIFPLLDAEGGHCVIGIGEEDFRRAASALASPAPSSGEFYEAQQHIGWLKGYVELMTADNWRDMQDKCAAQLDQLGKITCNLPVERPHGSRLPGFTDAPALKPSATRKLELEPDGRELKD